ncbi:MAG: phosphatidylserine decarboxylase [Myxococcales bacterium]|nr:phosphatidylserine decarboxylase [Myxococcales bacterium]
MRTAAWNKWLKVSFLEFVSQNVISQAVGRGSDLRLPKPLLRQLLRAFAGVYRINLDEMAEPLERYETFNQFFVRALKAGVRPIAASPVVSPADGRLSQFGPIENGSLLQVKGIRYHVDELLLGDAESRRYHDGTFFTVYLSPQNYHRVHSPVDGSISGFRYVPGRLFPVNDLAVANIPSLFTVNERLTSYIDTDFGRAALVMVGATSVGRMSLSYAPLETNQGAEALHCRDFDDPIAIRRGEELGRFNLGSTVVVLLPKAARVVFDRRLSPGCRVKLGEPLMRHADVGDAGTDSTSED